MLPAALLPDATLRLDDFALTSTTAVALLVATATSAPCPRCGTLSDRVHSHYRRTVGDLPCQDRRVVLRLVVRRFRCVDAACQQSIFCERLPAILRVHARTTTRLTDAHRAIGFSLGGEAGARLAERLDMPTSPDTLLRRVQDTPAEEVPTPRYVGVDDWAIRKGQRYGTILIDLERGRILDLLEGRDGSALTTWLKEHPGVEIITRDRWSAFARAADEGAPQARQVADRWHLLKNLREAVENLLTRHATTIRQALAEGDEVPVLAAAPQHATTEPAPRPATEPVVPASPKKQARQARQQERQQQYERVKELRAQGLSLRQIVQATGLSLKRVKRYVRSTRCPDWNTGRRHLSQLDAFASQVGAWIERGGRNAADLHRELVALGFTGSYDAVRRHLAQRLGSTGRPGPRVGPLSAPAKPTAPSTRKLSFLFARRPEDRKPEDHACLEKVRGCEATLREGLDLAGTFAEMVRQRSPRTLADWLTEAEGSACAELRSFAAGVRADEAAVGAALTEAWSNGPVEGHVNRLKTIKRQMFGRAGLQLLRARVRAAA